ncbi:MAG: AI-2E family transporter, partial [Bacteroidota bacterium]|nr:AI-2E family transporter [Bacteroidota bacterium]
VYVLIIARQILYPIVLALLFSYFIYPLVSLLENKLRFPKSLAALTGLIVFGGFMYGVGNLIAAQVNVFVGDFPVLKEQALKNFDALQVFVYDNFGITAVDQNLWMKEKIAEIFESGGEILSGVLHKATGALEALIFIPIFSFFMLSYRHRGYNFVLKLVEKRDGDLTEKLLEQISKVTIKYVTGVLSVVAILAVSHSTALSIIGVKYAIILGIFAAVFSVIPYFGTLIGGLVPLLVSAATMGNPYILVAIMLYFWAIIFIDHNILTPMIVGGNVSLNPFITILGIIIASTIWGIPGMIVVVPVLAVVKIVCDNIEGLKPWGYLLGGEDHGVFFDKVKGIANRFKRKS